MNAAASDIAERIRTAGRITFAEFMEAALYGPGGFYSSPGRSGARGDYFTAPQAHPAFGAAIAVQLHRYWRATGGPVAFAVAEIGAGDGLLAADITSYAVRLDAAFAGALQYSAFDRCPPPSPAYPVQGFEKLMADPVGAPACVISNELLDALPVHRFTVQKGRVLELFVTLDRRRFTEAAGSPSTPEIEARVGPLLHTLPDGFRGEVCLMLSEWARHVSRLVTHGIVITIDYGHERAALYSSARSRGTLRCYYRHTLSANPFDHVGEQDMTAHADFTAVDEAFAVHGFSRAGYTSQSEFLHANGIGQFSTRLRAACPSAHAYAANAAGIAALVRPEGMGGFRVAVHSRGILPDLLEHIQSPLSDADAGTLPVPLLRPGDRHIRLVPDDQVIAGPIPTWAAFLPPTN